MLFTKKLTPLKYDEVIRGLKALGFEMKPKTGTSHEQWVKISDGRKLLVTVDKHHAPFSRDLIKSMAKQAGMNDRKFHALCKGSVSLVDIGLQPSE
ncbi:type II toxin-antitoxin system HicA family toxin [Enterobacter oligotrophicus]|uniref:type II toxin-antitoxin system HicA family toxin n=1 Tax=Enterobacter TaxID=547 RepID=UPI001C02C400|nr:type II toxin-antitoxin system HicA family toxin [Enterobacter oligotrophicus]ELW1645802.1 type II toxin-antitoxin system HicA family toxin [Enterobacter oligotrophicus]MBT9426434.1 type II toxin-antitoxin system HicA family toxin [Enterobacter oligotrophicus]